MDPETIKQLEVLMDDSGNYDEITQAIEEKLVPTFEMLGKMLKSIDDKASGAMQKCQDIIACMTDAVNFQKRGQFEGLLSSHSQDLGPLDEFYSDTQQGNRFSDQLIDELMNTDVEDPEAYISGKINETKSKYGKYLGAQPPESPAMEAAEPAAEQTPAEEAGEVHEGEPAVVAEKVEVKKKKKPTSQDMASLLGLKMNEV